MTQMFKDMALSKEMQTDYTKFNKQRTQDVEMIVEVLTNGNWPIEDQPACNLPKQMIV